MEHPDLDATAYHEAGHAVLALILGRPVHGVSVRATEDLLGHCDFGKARFRPSEDWVEREALIALGGLAAEARFTGDYAFDEAGRDLRYVRELARERAGSERQAERLEKRWLAKAENFLSKPGHWLAVERIARELIANGQISGRTARHLFDQAVREDE